MLLIDFADKALVVAFILASPADRQTYTDDAWARCRSALARGDVEAARVQFANVDEFQNITRGEEVVAKMNAEAEAQRLAYAPESDPCVHNGVFAIDSVTARWCPSCYQWIPASEL